MLFSVEDYEEYLSQQLSTSSSNEYTQPSISAFKESMVSVSLVFKDYFHEILFISYKKFCTSEPQIKSFLARMEKA